MSNQPLKITCEKECDIEFWTDDDDAEFSTKDFKETTKKNKHHKIYHFDKNKDFKMSLTKSKSDTLKYKIVGQGEDTAEKEYKFVNPKQEKAANGRVRNKEQTEPNVNNQQVSRRESARAALPKNSCSAVHKYIWEDNSCYRDSLFFALFAFPCKQFIDKLFNRRILTQNLNLSVTKKIDKVLDSNRLIKFLQEISKTLTSNTDSSVCPVLPDSINLNKILRDGNTQHSPEEQLNKIFDVLELETVTKTETITKVTKDGTNNSDPRKIYSSPIIILERGTYPTKNIPNQLSHSNTRDDDLQADGAANGVKLRTTIKTEFDYKTSIPFIVLALERLEARGERRILDETPIEFPEYITIPVSEKETNLPLNQVVYYFGGHYTCYFQCSQRWYLYNDNGEDEYGNRIPTITLVGTFAGMLKQTKKGWTMLFYNIADTSKPSYRNSYLR